jgi:predicted glutamine amidotransferase
MCRLLAYAAREQRAVTELLAGGDFESFRSLSRLHRDGWGMAWLPEGAEDGSIRSARSVVPAFMDDEFAPLSAARLGRAGFVHLRWATGDLAVAEANTHPFLAGGWAFAHQGEIFHHERIDELMAPDWRARRRGDTDSERFFLHALECMEREGDLVEGITAAAGGILAACGSASLNSVMLSASSLVAIYGAIDLPSPRDDLLAAVARPEDVPLDHMDGYFRLRYRRGEDHVLISSSGVSGDGWVDIPEGSIVHVDLEELEMTVHPLDGGRLLEEAADASTLTLPDG